MYPPEVDGYPLLITTAAYEADVRFSRLLAQSPEYVQPESRIENPVGGPDLGATIKS